MSFEENVIGDALGRAAEKFAERAEQERTHWFRYGDLNPGVRCTPEKADEMVPCAMVPLPGGDPFFIVGLPAEALS